MQNNEYRIYIHNVVEHDSKETPEQEAASLPTPQKAEKTADKAPKSTAYLIATQVGKEALSFALQNYGDLTGDYGTQQLVQVGLGLASDVSSIAIASLSGGWVGFGIAATGVALKYGSQVASFGLNYAKERQRNQILSERLRIVSTGGDRR